MHKQMVVGIGTGRCGTVSLHALLNRQPGVHITHEQLPLLPWNSAPNILEKKLAQILKRRTAIVGDIATSWLPYVRDVLSKEPSAKFVCLQRDRNATVQSFVVKMKGRKNHWLLHDGKSWKKDRRWDPCFPKYDTPELALAIGWYWDDYYRQVDLLCAEFPDNVRKWQTEQALDSPQGVKELLSFIGVRECDQNCTVGIKLNRGGVRAQSHPPKGLLRVRNLFRQDR